MTHTYIRNWIACAALVAPALLVSAGLAAQGTQVSPHYVNARRFLKTAQILIQVPPQPNVQLALKPADEAVGAAISELDRGAHTSSQAGAEQLGAGASQMTAQQRLRSIVDLLHSARTEIMQETSGESKAGPASPDWRDAALRHIAAALDAVHRAAIDAHLDREIGSF